MFGIDNRNANIRHLIWITLSLAFGMSSSSISSESSFIVSIDAVLPMFDFASSSSCVADETNVSKSVL